MRIGILSVQGNDDSHRQVLASLGVTAVNVTLPRHLSGLSGLIIPGGESTVMLKFLSEGNFFNAIKEFAENGGCLFGTCAGAILLAKDVKNPEQQSLGLINITIERNAFGRQLASKIVVGKYQNREDLAMVFIRAPKIVRVGENVRVFASWENQPVGVMQGRHMLTTFHPELSNNPAIHRFFVEQCYLRA